MIIYVEISSSVERLNNTLTSYNEPSLSHAYIASNYIIAKETSHTKTSITGVLELQ